MKCPRCGKDMLKSNSHVFCSHCGYLDDGKQIHGYEEKQVSDLEIYLGDEYNKIYRNENFIVSLILGPLYLIYRGFLLTGLIFLAVEPFIWNIIGNSFSAFSPILSPLAFIVTRLFFMTANNMICLYFYQKKIDKIKKKNPDNYLEILRNKRKQIPIGIAILVILFTIFICVLLIYYFINKALQ